MGYKKENLIALFFAAVIISITFQGCQPPKSPTQEPGKPPQLIPTQVSATPTPATEFRQIKPSSPKQGPSSRTVSQFLIDETASADCSNDQNDLVNRAYDFRYDVPRFLISLGVLLDKEDFLNFGVSTFDVFGKRYHPIISLHSVEFFGDTTPWYFDVSLEGADQRLRNHLINEDNIAGEDYAKVFEKARDDLNTSGVSGERKTLIILTDGSIISWEFNADYRERIRMALYGGDNSPEVYVVLLCPSKTLTDTAQKSFWIDKTDASGVASLPNVEVFNAEDSPETWVKDLTLGIANEYLPSDEDEMWIDQTHSNLPISVPVGVKSVSIRVVSFQEKRIELQDINGNDLGMIPGHVSNIRSKTLDVQYIGSECNPINYRLKGYDNPLGFYLLQPDLSGFQIQIDRPPYTTNQNEVEITGRVSGQLPTDTLQSCYRVQMRSEDLSLLPRLLPCASDKLCINPGGNLEATWQWQPHEMSAPMDIPFTLIILTGGNTVGTVDFKMPVYFQADPYPTLDSSLIIKFQDKIRKNLRPLLDVIVYTINFKFDAQRPEVLMETHNADLPYTNKELTNLGKDAYGNNYTCPIDKGSGWITLQEKGGPLSGSSPIQFSPIQGNGEQAKYEITIYKYVAEKCGFNEVSFQWIAGDHVLPMSAVYYYLPSEGDLK